MTTDRELERALTDWLERQPSQAPIDLARSVFADLEQVPQRAWWRLALRRNPVFNSNAGRVAIAAAALVVAVAAGALWLGRPGLGPGNANPSPSSTATSAAGPSATPPVSIGPSPSPRFLSETLVSQSLAGGRYETALGSVVPAFWLNLTFPAGWTVTKVTHTEVDSGGAGEGAPWLGLFTVGRVYKDPCHPEKGVQGGYLGTSNAQNMEDELTNLVGFTSTPATSLQIGGYDARAFTISNAIDTATAGCTRDQLLPLFMTDDVPDRDAELTKQEYSPATNGGATQHMWVVERNGWGLLIVAEWPDGNAAAQQTIQDILDSIVIKP